MNSYNNMVEKNPKVLGGMPVISGTRISVAEILTAISGGKSIEQIVEDLNVYGYKNIKKSHVVEAINYSRKFCL